MTSLQPGATLQGKFLIERVLGEGGTGTVYQAVHLRMRTRVAIKVLDRLHTANRVSVSRFEREARAAACLRGSHAVKVYDVDTTDDGVPFMVMERLYGRELLKVLQEAPLPVATAVDWTIQICSAIQEAHDLGIIHRDLKPSNIFVVEPGELIKIVDFGISKHADGEELTADSEVLGTPKYMAPEQLRGQPVCPQTDVWAIGIVLYRMLTGEHAFPTPKGAPSFVAATATLVHEPVPIREHRPDLPEALADVVMLCLRKQVEQRWGSARDLAEAIVPFGSGAAKFEEVAPVPKDADSWSFIHVQDPAAPMRSPARTALAVSEAQGTISETATALEPDKGFPDWPTREDSSIVGDRIAAAGSSRRSRRAGAWPWLAGVVAALGLGAAGWAWWSLTSTSAGATTTEHADAPAASLRDALAPAAPDTKKGTVEGPIAAGSRDAGADASDSAASAAPSARPAQSALADQPKRRVPRPALSEHPAKSTPLYL